MKIKVIEKCWYNNKLYDPEINEEIIEFKGNKCPSWGEVIGDKEQKQDKKDN